MVLYGMVLYGTVWCDMVWCCMVCCGVVWYGVVLYGVVWYGMVSSHVFRCDYSDIHIFNFAGCPGNVWNPCNGKAQCLDGREGNGSCLCEEPYFGKACERCNSTNCSKIFL